MTSDNTYKSEQIAYCKKHTKHTCNNNKLKSFLKDKKIKEVAYKKRSN